LADPLYRSFVLETPSIWKVIVEFVKRHAQASIAREAPLHLFIVSDDLDRLDVQVAFYWSVVLKRIAEDAWVDGKQFPAKNWHEQLAGEFLGFVEVVDKKTQQPKLQRRSIARGCITVGEMARYTIQVQAWAANNFSIDWD
jgi:hypothetical protein